MRNQKAGIKMISTVSKGKKEPTHILDNSSSCIDLIFTSQANRIEPTNTTC